ncbi:MAG TPA: thioredoxin domain-containing protein [Solirubrobacteraceae bacterium]|jgi:protein-disulfide isomerase|nr:thioredoxin domain-containing protein [Solirubrobacteraceae bacterium]
MASPPSEQERLRAERIEGEQQMAAAGLRRRRMLQGGAVLAIAVIVVVVLVIVSSSDHSGQAKKLTKSTANATQVMIAGWVAGTTQGVGSGGDLTWGSASAPVIDREYVDLQCSACDDLFVGPSRNGGAEVSLLPYIREGKVQLQIYPLESVTPTAAMVNTEWGGLLAAGQQGKGIQYLFTNYVFQPPEGSFTLSNIFDTAKATQGLNYAQWNVARTNPDFVSQITAVAQMENSRGLDETPTTILSNAKGQSVSPFVGVYPVAAYEQAIAQLGG